MDKFNYANYLFNSTNKVRQTISELPSHISEFVMIFVLLLILFYLINIGDVHSSYNITLAGVFGYTFLKLKPIYSNIFNVFVGLKYSKRALDRVMYDLSINKNFKKSRQPSMSFKKEIIFNNVSFSFKNRNKIFSNLNLKIKKKSIFGIKGKSGSGKTTLINLIIGLLKPDIGNIYIDNINLLNSNASNFHKIIGFAPQETFILNSSIKENIALGTDTHNISDKSINNLINIVCLDNFLKNNFGGDLNKSIGDKGIKISGGERQRIGIARALFRNPDILILDEATSGIDINTEAKILKNILTHFPLITVIIISHRHSSLKNCTEILDLGFI
jgi:ABC-type bacteriocin/lantibiotic exporter with double-glycine peptidase domain